MTNFEGRRLDQVEHGKMQDTEATEKAQRSTENGLSFRKNSIITQIVVDFYPSFRRMPESSMRTKPGSRVLLCGITGMTGEKYRVAANLLYMAAGFL